MTRFALTIEFDGGPYMGWQWQDHGPSVQGAIEEAIFKTTGEKTLVYSAGRTDAGVHARISGLHDTAGLQTAAGSMLRSRRASTCLTRQTSMALTMANHSVRRKPCLAAC
jgi:tRNA U38,U39,U40 pseudouridine synthase TruA